jgi:SAM-dependent methyltransferase
MRAAATRGWVAAGVEVAPRAAEAVASEGFEVHLGTLEDAGLDEASFDIVSLVEVVEHVGDAESLLRAAHRVLRPGGALYLTTPHGRGLSARLLGTRWSIVSPPEHLQLFSVRGITAALQRAGLQPRRLRAHGVNPHELMARARMADSGCTFARVETSYQLNEALSRNHLGTATKATANAALSVLRLGDTLKVTAERVTTPHA